MGVKANKSVSVFSVSLLIAGATIGAGILGLPVQAGLSGFLPSVLGTIFIWVLMTITALIISERFIRDNNIANDYPTIFKEDFGPLGKLFAVLGYLINYYGVMIAYLCASIAILQYLIPMHMPSFVFLLIFYIPTALITLYGLIYVIKANSLFMFILIASFICLIFLSAKEMTASRFDYTDWHYLLPAMPIIMNAFLFHNIIPSVCRGFNNDRVKIMKSIIYGTIIACVINLVWLIVGIGALPMGGEGHGNLLYAFLNSQPATVPLAIALHSKYITTAGMIFSLAAIFTSFVSVVIGLRGFLRDLLISTFKIDNTVLTVVLTLFPALIIAILFPHFFIGALDFAGGVGGVLIFGVFPAMILIKYSGRKKKYRNRKIIIGAMMFIVFAFLIAFQILQEFGSLKIKPRIEIISKQ